MSSYPRNAAKSGAKVWFIPEYTKERRVKFFGQSQPGKDAFNKPIRQPPLKPVPVPHGAILAWDV